MPALPAWPLKSLPRLFVETPLGAGAQVELDAGQANYLGNVMRLNVGDGVLIFDGLHGEWLAQITDKAKKRMALTCQEQTRAQEAVPPVTLAFAPVKRQQTDWLVEKATELGVAAFQPVITQRTIVDRVKLERLRAIAIEAAEQCHRTAIPAFAEPVSLKTFLAARDTAIPLYFADETGGAHALDRYASGPAILLTGPEGGFTPEEGDAIRAAAGATAISLGPRILRAETAALTGLATFMAKAGDWK